MGSTGLNRRGVGVVVWVVGMVRPARVVRSTPKKSPVTAMFSRENTPFSTRPEIPAPPHRLFSSTQPAPPGQNKAPEESPGLSFWVVD